MANNNIAISIKSLVDMKSVLSMYGFEVDKSGFILCPFHNEKTASCKIYKDSFYCFGCGASGDCISFVMGVFGISFAEAVTRIDSDFSLGVVKKGKASYRDKIKFRGALREQREKEEARIAKEEYSRYAYKMLIFYRRWLAQQEQTKAILSDLEYIDRLLEMYLSPQKLIKWDIKALLTSLMQKHKKGGISW